MDSGHDLIWATHWKHFFIDLTGSRELEARPVTGSLIILFDPATLTFEDVIEKVSETSALIKSMDQEALDSIGLERDAVINRFVGPSVDSGGSGKISCNDRFHCFRSRHGLSYFVRLSQGVLWQSPPAWE